MKISVWIKYEEPYLPPRCRKLRYRECDEYVLLPLQETTMKNLRLAFEVTTYEGICNIYSYKRKFWRRAIMRDISCSKEADNHTPLENLLYVMAHSSRHFYSFRQRGLHCEDTSKDAIIKGARADLRRYLLVDGDLYIQTAEPRYCIYTFGLGHNHGGTSLSVDYRYNSNISKDRYYSALQGEEAVAEAIKIATKRGDTDSINSLKEKIKVFAPDLVKVNPKRQHRSSGNPILNMMDAITESAPDVLTAGLLCISVSASSSHTDVVNS